MCISAFSCHIYSKIGQLLLHPIVGRFSCHPPNLLEFSFIVFECPILHCFTLSQYLFNLLSFVRTCRFISSSCIVIISCVAFSFLFQNVPVIFLCFIIFACFQRFFICISSRISHPGFYFCSFSLRESLILLLHRLVHLIRLYLLLIYMLVLDLFFLFPFSLFSILCF